MNRHSAAVRSPGTRAARRLAAVAVLGLGTACHPGIGKHDVASGDGVKCGVVPSAPAVYIDVTYDASGMPQVAPGTCEIDSGTTVTWRGPEGAQVAFAVRFKQASPVAGDERGMLPATETGGRYRVSRTLSGRGSYPYGVSANGKTLDPAIIIR